MFSGKMSEAMKKKIQPMLTGIERYNPNNITTLESYVDLQVRAE